MVLQGWDGFVQPKLFGVVGADGTRARDADVPAGRIAETIFGVRDFLKLSDLVRRIKRRTQKLVILPGEAAHRPYADLLAIGCSQVTPVNLFYELLYLLDVHNRTSFPYLRLV